MKLFIYNNGIERKVNDILTRSRQLMNGEVSRQLQSAGMNYTKVYGVSLVNLRQLAQQYERDNNLAERLWFRGIRETMIMATMLSLPDQMDDQQVLEWAALVNNIELAEQFAFNLLGRKMEINAVVGEMVANPGVHVRYTALMSIGWHFRFVGTNSSNIITHNLREFESLAANKALVRAVSHCLKMAAQHVPVLAVPILTMAHQWIEAGDVNLQLAGLDIADGINNQTYKN